MTKVVSRNTATPGQVHEMYLQVERALKGTPDVQKMMSRLLNAKVFEKVAKEFIKADGGFVSEKFEPTDFVVSTTPSGDAFNIKKDIKKLLPTKEEDGLLDYRDSDIVSWFGDVTFTDTEAVSGRVQLFKSNITHRDIIAEGENLGIYQEYELGHALLLANELVKAGAIEKPGYGLIIYLKNRKGDNRDRLDVWRGDDGRLRVGISSVGLDDGWDAGDGVLFSN